MLLKMKGLELQTTTSGIFSIDLAKLCTGLIPQYIVIFLEIYQTQNMVARYLVIKR
jgi:hypothetical protein